MQNEELHRSFGRGRNVSCNNFNCKNYRHKIGRRRSNLYVEPNVCPICGVSGFVHDYTCKVGKNNIMLCNCH